MTESRELEKLNVVKGLRELANGEPCGDIVAVFSAGFSTRDDDGGYTRITPAGRELLELLDAAQPERREGRCWCEYAAWWYFVATEQRIAEWSRGLQGLHETRQYGFCDGCGAALREGYAERGGDTRRLEVLAKLVRAEDYSVRLYDEADDREKPSRIEWGIGQTAYGSDLRAALDDPQLAASADAASFAAPSSEDEETPKG